MDLMQRLEAHSFGDPNSGCQIWLGALVRDHGILKVNGKPRYAHRVAYELGHGPIPPKKWVLHKCGTASCIRIDHLKLGTRLQNAKDRLRHGGYIGKEGGGLQAGPQISNASTHARVPVGAHFEMSFSELTRVLDYSPATGVFTWRTRQDRDIAWNNRFSGNEAGAVITNGYRYINIMNKGHLAHRLAWLYMTGEWPKAQVDHINGDRADNRWTNLRAATSAQNGANVGLRSTNKSGVKGVSWDLKKNCWRAQIMVNYKALFLGYFASVEEASAARRAAEEVHHGVFARTQGNA